MQKAFVAIAFALALTCAFGYYSPIANTWTQAPVPVCRDNETNFTNQTIAPSLASLTSGNVYLIVSTFASLNVTNTSALSWALWYKQLNSKTLAATSNTSTTYTAPLSTTFGNNYAYGFNSDNDTGIPQLRVYQLPLTSGVTGPNRLTIGNNSNSSFTPSYINQANIGNTVYVFYLAAFQTVNVTSFTIGSSSAPSTPNTLSTTCNTYSTLNPVWGQSLGSKQLFVSWIEGGVLKDVLYNVATGNTAAPAAVTGYNSSLNCYSYATDGTLYGEICYLTNTTTLNTTFYIKTNSSGLFPFVTYPTNTSTGVGAFGYGPYLSVFFQNTIATTGNTTWGYEIWNLANFSAITGPRGGQIRTNFLTLDTGSSFVSIKIPSGGLYGLLYNANTASNTTNAFTSLQVGLVLGSSYLASVVGFVMTDRKSVV